MRAQTSTLRRPPAPPVVCTLRPQLRQPNRKRPVRESASPCLRASPRAGLHPYLRAYHQSTTYPFQFVRPSPAQPQAVRPQRPTLPVFSLPPKQPALQVRAERTSRSTSSLLARCPYLTVAKRHTNQNTNRSAYAQTQVSLSAAVSRPAPRPAHLAKQTPKPVNNIRLARYQTIIISSSCAFAKSQQSSFVIGTSFSSLPPFFAFPILGTIAPRPKSAQDTATSNLFSSFFCCCSLSPAVWERTKRRP